MSNIAIPNSFSPNVVIQSALVNADFAEVQNKFNTYAVQTDTAKTITVSHTWTANQIHTTTSSVALTITTTGATAVALTGTSAPPLTINLTDAAALNSIVVLSRAGTNLARLGLDASDNYAILNGAGSIANVTITQAGVATIRGGLVVSAGGITATGNSTITGTLGGVTTLTATTVAGTLSTAAQPNITSVGTLAGLTVGGAGLSVSAGGASITGSSLITGNLTVTGSISAVTGSNSYVRRTSDLNYTSGTDLTLTFAIGAAEEWEFEYHLVSTNASAATMSFTVAGPASCTGHFAGLGTTNNNATAIVGDAEVAFGNAMSTFNMNATACWAHIKGYVKGGGTPGNVTIAGTVSAGTGVLKAGSFIRYSRIA